MALRCLVIDDDPLIGDLLQHFCSKSEQIGYCNVVTTALGGLNVLSAGGVDLIFLDFHLPDMKGQEFLELMQSDVPVIMVTSESDFAAQSYEYRQVKDFLTKPLKFDRFQKAIQRIVEAENPLGSSIDASEEGIFIKDGNKLVQLNLSTILYIKSEGNYCHFIGEDNKILSLVSMKELEAKLPKQFVRVHRSFMVNIKKIQVITTDEITIHDHHVPVGEKYRSELLGLIKEL